MNDARSTGDELLDSALQLLASSKKTHDPMHWVRKLGERRGLKDQLARRLVKRGILREEEHRFLWVFESSRYPTSDPRVEASIRDRIRNVALDGAEPDQRKLLLLSVVNAAKLADGLFASEERSSAKRRVKLLVEDERFGKAVNAAIHDAIAIIVASTTAATTAAASH